MIKREPVKTVLFVVMFLALGAISWGAIEQPDLLESDCIKCHQAEVETLASRGGPHRSEINCSDCHREHPLRGDDTVAGCSECHEPHSPSMKDPDCLACHHPHYPTEAVALEKISVELCASCHESIVTQIQQQGLAHRDALACSDCHLKHPPAEGSAPLACASCHSPEDNSHFGLHGCIVCHLPHAPQSRPFEDMPRVRAACLSCHEGPGKDTQAHPSAHAEMGCTECHASHGEIPACLDCHEPHTESMSTDECMHCHSAHAPTAYQLDEELETPLCAGCHEDLVIGFVQQGAAHREELTCAGCHTSHPPSEGAIPSCAECHGPEDKSHYGLNSCSQCHDPHAPMSLDMSNAEGVRAACLSCHPGPGQLMNEAPGAHAAMECSECHQKHGETQHCMECHEPHREDMPYKECLQCHSPHQSTQIAYRGRISPSQCGSCHTEPVTDIASEGGAHATEIACLDCHQAHQQSGCLNCHESHPQSGIGLPESCTLCHDPAEKTHYGVGGCAQCHPPHSPMQINLEAFAPIMPVCLSCHPHIGKAEIARPSAHGQMDCIDCHNGHEGTHSCLDCHEGHEPEMSYEDCLSCHKPHTPTDIAFESATAPSLCRSCHDEEVTVVAESGGAHKTQVSCADCHPQHAPYGKETISDCNKCHKRYERRHFAVESCLPCHSPHEPLKVDFSTFGTAKPVCLSCHMEVRQFMKFSPSKHEKMDCSACHLSHTEFKNCLDCHAPHSEEMSYADCLGCHQPHTPTDIAYSRQTPPNQCASCHEETAGQVKNRGFAHSTKVTCAACHREHPPKGEERYLECARCHDLDDKSHYALPSCKVCHPPHAPLDVVTGDADVKPACLTCHTEQEEAMQAHPSAHAQVDCGQCHFNHNNTHACTECHDGHGTEMTAADCQLCHQPHTPIEIQITGGVPKAFCSPCHEEVASALTDSTAKHRDLECLSCHPGEHGFALSCNDCHGEPHEEGLHQKYPDCLQCHGDPHSLAQWRTDAAR